MHLLDQRSAGTVHDALWHAGGAGRIHDVDRMIERQHFELRRMVFAAGEIVPRHGAAQSVERQRVAGVGHHDELLDARNLLEHAAHLRQAVEALAAVAVRIGREQHFRLDLAEAVDHAVDTEIRRAGRPRGAERRRGEHSDHGFRHVRHEAGDAVAVADAGLPERVREAADFGMQLGVGELALVAPLVAEHDRRAVVLVAQQVLREVEAHLRKPACSRHLFRIDQHRREVARGADSAEFPDQRPELFRRTHGEVVQRRVAADVLVADALAHEAHEAIHVGALDALVTRFPDRLVHGLVRPQCLATSGSVRWRRAQRVFKLYGLNMAPAAATRTKTPARGRRSCAGNERGSADQ